MALELHPDFGPDDRFFPQLPEIGTDSIRLQVFTHRSYFGRPTHVFEDHPNDLSPDNERLEHLGDTVLQLAVTSLMFDIYPGLRVGPATKIRALIVGNATLARISLKYKLPDRLRLHPAQCITLRASITVQADLFEAFVGGLYLDQGLARVRSWLDVLLQPYAAAAYRVIRIQHGLPPDPPSFTLLMQTAGTVPVPGARNGIDILPPSTDSGLLTPRHMLTDLPTPGTTTGHLALFNQYVQSKQVEWVFSSRDPSLPEAAASDTASNSSASSSEQTEASLLLKSRKTTPVWFAKVLVDGEPLGSGKGGTKKAAKNEAAKQGLDKMGIFV